MDEAGEGNTPLPEVLSIEVNTEEPTSEGLGAAPVTQSILEDMTNAATGTFSSSEWSLFYQGLVDSGDRYSTIIATLRRRVAS